VFRKQSDILLFPNMYAGRVNLGVQVGEGVRSCENHLNIERAIPAGSEGSQPMEIEVVATAHKQSSYLSSVGNTGTDHQGAHGKTSQEEGNCHFL
jgi:hypothetical protein